jgi:hypothetical protein
MLPDDLPKFRKQRDRTNGNGRQRFRDFLDRPAEREAASKEVVLPEVPISSLPRVKEIPVEDAPGVERH